MSEPEIDNLEQHKELLADAEQTKQELEARQNEALLEIAEGENLERYATVELGELEVEVLEWLPGDVEDKVMEANSLVGREDAEAMRKSRTTIIEALAEMTVSEDFNETFWEKYHRKYGQEALIIAADTVFDPAMNAIEEREDAMDGFRQGGEGPESRADLRDDRPTPE